MRMKLIDNSKLGAYKIERYILRAFITGAKSYLVKCTEHD